MGEIEGFYEIHFFRGIKLNFRGKFLFSSRERISLSNSLIQLVKTLLFSGAGLRKLVSFSTIVCDLI